MVFLSASRSLVLLLLIRDLLVAEEHLAHLLGDVAELVLVLAGELGDGGLRDVAELVLLVAREVAHHLGGEVAELVLLAQVARDPLGAPPVELLGHVAEGVLPLARELEGLALGTLGDLFREIARLVRLLARELGGRRLDARVDLNAQIARDVLVVAGQLAHLLLDHLVDDDREVAQLVVLLAAQLGHLLLDSPVRLLAHVAQLVVIAAGELTHVLLERFAHGAAEHDEHLRAQAQPLLVLHEEADCLLVGRREQLGLAGGDVVIAGHQLALGHLLLQERCGAPREERLPQGPSDKGLPCREQQQRDRLGP
mmetsp:Transcript_3398/g.8508  ORF Transcript_3398/g.8508 Transcript_3398/m.8508 type:complete len:311 (+) Transcript_3398:82-1014(+)